MQCLQLLDSHNCISKLWSNRALQKSVCISISWSYPVPCCLSKLPRVVCQAVASFNWCMLADTWPGMFRRILHLQIGLRFVCAQSMFFTCRKNLINFEGNYWVLSCLSSRAGSRLLYWAWVCIQSKHSSQTILLQWLHAPVHYFNWLMSRQFGGHAGCAFKNAKLLFEQRRLD